MGATKPTYIYRYIRPIFAENLLSLEAKTCEMKLFSFKFAGDAAKEGFRTDGIKGRQDRKCMVPYPLGLKGLELST